MCEYTSIQLQCNLFIYFFFGDRIIKGPRCLDPGDLGWKIYGLICGVGVFDRSSIRHNVITPLI